MSTLRPTPSPWSDGTLSPDMSRAWRSTIAFMVPLLLAVTGWLPVNASFATLTAQNLAMVDVRGDYRFRLGLLLGMAAVFIGAAALGTAVANSLPAAVIATVFIALCSSAWRHLSTDYGPGLAIASSFVFLFGLATPPEAPAVANHCLATAAGAAWGILVQVAAWPFRPQHPLRRAVADAWVAVAELFDAMSDPVTGHPAAAEELIARETAVRSALDYATAALTGPRPTPVRAELSAMNFAGARLAMRVSALNTAFAALRSDPALPWLGPAIEPLIANLSNLARSIAVTIVSRQPAHFGTAEVRLRRASALLAVVRARLTRQAADGRAAQLEEILAQIEAHLPAIHQALRATVGRAGERGAFSLELLDLRAVALRPLASALNLTWRVDPALVRFALRSAILTAAGVVAYKWLQLPHGYWLPFTTIVVLQPDYGSTRQRAAQRVLGTLAGSVAATGILWLHLPMPVLMAACAATIFTFGYWLKRNYGIAVIFITLFVVLLTEATGPVTIGLAVERVGSTLAGGLLALLAAQLFWPVWERDRLPPVLAAAVRTNARYLDALVERVRRGGAFDAPAVAVKREVERANAAAFSSLNRLNGDPRNQREGLDHLATLGNGNQRITRALNLLALHLADETPWDEERVARFAALAQRAFEAVALAIEGRPPPTSELHALLEALESGPLSPPGAAPAPNRWAFAQLTQVTTELCALLIAMQEAAPARA